MSPDDMIPVTLSAQQWNIIMSLIAAANTQLISTIQSQCVNFEMQGVKGAQRVSDKD